MLNGLWQKLFGCQQQQQAGQLYSMIMKQARLPLFYDNGVEDNMDKRFEMLMLHLFLVLNAMKKHAELEEQAQALFDYAFDDMDRTLREIGVGDLSVGKKVRGLAEVFYGRVKQYKEALDSGNPKEAIAAVLTQTLALASQKPLYPVLCEYVVEAAIYFDSLTVVHFQEQNLSFPVLPEKLG
jgi:cytochrome b pre-mRNA-processing protein 3